MHRFDITSFEEKYTEAICSLILDIQQKEFQVPITLADQPDLLKIPSVYQQNGGNFWVAVAEAEAEVVGSNAISNQESAIKNQESAINNQESAINNQESAINNQVVVGSIALIDCGEGIGCIRKMFVRADWRGKESGIAQQLLDTLEAWAVLHGMAALYLGTIERLQAAIRFYVRNGFAPVAPEALPASFPRMAVDTHFFGKGI